MEHRCKDCDYKLTAHTLFENPEATPRAGDISICFGCGAVRVFNHDCEIIDLPDSFKKQFPDDYKNAMRLSERIKLFKKERKGGSSE